MVAAVRKAEAIELGDLPYLPLVHLNAIEIRRKDTWHGWTPSPAADRRAALRGIPADPRAAARARPVAARPGAARRPRRARDDGWLTTPRSVLIGSVLIALAIIGSTFIASGQPEDRAARVD